MMLDGVNVEFVAEDGTVISGVLLPRALSEKAKSAVRRLVKSDRSLEIRESRDTLVELAKTTPVAIYRELEKSTLAELAKRIVESGRPVSDEEMYTRMFTPGGMAVTFAEGMQPATSAKVLEEIFADDQQMLGACNAYNDLAKAHEEAVKNYRSLNENPPEESPSDLSS